jgi:hypothetical protein
LQQAREKLLDKSHKHQQKIKETFDKKEKTEQFLPGDLILKWDSRREDHHVKFDSLWIGPLRVEKVLNNNTFLLQNLEGQDVFYHPFCSSKIYLSYLSFYISKNFCIKF